MARIVRGTRKNAERYLEFAKTALAADESDDSILLKQIMKDLKIGVR